MFRVSTNLLFGEKVVDGFDVNCMNLICQVPSADLLTEFNNECAALCKEGKGVAEEGHEWGAAISKIHKALKNIHHGRTVEFFVQLDLGRLLQVGDLL